MTSLQPLRGIKVEVSGARGPSLGDLARRLGSFGAAPGDSDAVVLDKLAGDIAASTLATSRLYPTTTAGLAATNNGQYFSVPETDDDFLILYRNDGGAAVEVNRYPSKQAIAALLGSGGSALVGFMQSGAGSVGRTVQDRLRETLSVRDKGATGDGTTSDRAAFQSAAAQGAFIVPPGRYFIGDDVQIAADATFLPGASIVVGDGIEVTFTGQINAGVGRIFELTDQGNVALNSERNLAGFAEWWGIAADGVDSFVAIRRAMASGLRRLTLLRRDYYGPGGLILPANVKVIGEGENYQGPNTATRLLSTSASGPVVQLGNLTPAGGTFSNSPRGMGLSDLYVGRTVAHAGGDADATGVHVGFCLEATCDRVRVGGAHTSAWRFGGSVFFKGRDLRAKRDVAAASGTDVWYGYKTGGIGGLSSIGENASLYLDDCQSEFNLAPTFESSHIHLSGLMTDTFINDFECVGGRVGIALEGDGDTASSLNTANDIHIHRPTIDQVTERGIYIHNLRKAGFVEITGAYIGMPSGRQLVIDGSYGRVQVDAETYQHVGGDPSISITNSANVRMRAFVSEAVIGCVTGNIRGCELQVHQTNIGRAASAIFQSIGGTQGTVFKASAEGGAAKIAVAYQTLNSGAPWGTNDYNEFHTTMLKANPALVAMTSFGAGSDANSVTVGVS